ncbi:MAG: MFS transporter [Alicyclobacillaceae bacterium]|uniref:MFS transporter n=1 Tax=Alicyclobacillus sp. SP_1 TaxID=2942475 RepID=UPI00215721EB|nr:MFS transporter [Alicyclobacillus sp. SP_1]MCY0887744.1 MFS transporter [Alicyclobacillaceae bacterium]
MGSLFRNRNFVILFSGQMVSMFGNSLFALALPWYVYSLTGSKVDLGITGLVSTLPGFAQLFSGVFVDRWPKRLTMILSDFFRAALSAAMFLVAIGHEKLLILLILLFFLELVGTFFSPASSAFLPLVVSEESIPAASGMTQSSSSFAQLAGTVSGGALIGLLGAPLLFVLNSISFLCSCISLLFLRHSEDRSKSSSASSVHANRVNSEQTGSPEAGAQPTISRLRVFLDEWLEGFRLLTSTPFVRVIIASAVLVNFAFAPLFTALTAWVKGPLHGTAFVLSTLDGGFFLGIIGGGLLVGPLSSRLSLRLQLASGLALIGVFLGLLPVVRNSWFDASLMLLCGVSVGFINGSLFATIVRLIPPELRGRVFGTLGALVSVANPVGLAITTVVLPFIPLWTIFVAITVISLGASSLYLLPMEANSDSLLLVPGTSDQQFEELSEPLLSMSDSFAPGASSTPDAPEL